MDLMIKNLDLQHGNANICGRLPESRELWQTSVTRQFEDESSNPSFFDQLERRKIDGSTEPVATDGFVVGGYGRLVV